MSTNTKSALCVLVPPHEDLQAVRRQHDQAYDRWPPHINLVFPFVDHLDDPRIDDAIRGFGAFEVTLSNKLDFFAQRKQRTVHMVPSVDTERSLAALHARVVASMNLAPPKRPYCGHLTVGQIPKSQHPDVLGPIAPIHFVCQEVAVLTRTDDTPFRIHRTISLQ